MILKPSDLASSRRDFILRVLPAGTLFCLGCKGLLAAPCVAAAEASPGQKPKYLDNSGMSIEEVYRFGYGYFIPTFQALAGEIGKEKFLPMLSKATLEAYSQMIGSVAKDYPDRSMKSLASFFQAMMSVPPANKAFSYETIESTDKVLAFQFSECLPARIFREMNAADIGYALECSPTDAIAKSFNPKMRAENPKNLMKGDSVCIERFVLEA